MKTTVSPLHPLKPCVFTTRPPRAGVHLLIKKTPLLLSKLRDTYSVQERRPIVHRQRHPLTGVHGLRHGLCTPRVDAQGQQFGEKRAAKRRWRLR